MRNVERAVTVWNNPSGEPSLTHVCLEYSSPAEKLGAHNASLGVPLGGQEVKLSYQDSESLATIYSVSEIMQFGHAALYRLCEAAGNGSIDQKTYGQLFQSTINNMQELLHVQLVGQKNTRRLHAETLKRQVRALDDDYCGLAVESTPNQGKIDANKAQRQKLIAEYEALRTAGSEEADALTALAAEELPTPGQIQSYRDAANKLSALAADKKAEREAQQQIMTANRLAEKCLLR